MAVRIGISASPTLFEGRMLQEVTRAYVDSVRRAGGLPVIIPVLDPADVDDILDGIDGLLLSGGGDIDPGRYGAPAHPSVDGVDAGRDEWELALVRRAVERAVPVLGVCRGAQVINVAAGGTLVPDLPGVTDQLHRERERFDEDIHPVDVATDSRLARAMGLERARVNTLHHQAVDQVGLGLAAVAWSPDGVVEGIEGLTAAPVLGVQWHPELLPHLPGNPELFAWLVAEATRATGPETVPATATLAAGPGIGLVDAVA